MKDISMSLGLGSDIATGITDEHHGESGDKIVESPLPFFICYTLWTKNSVFPFPGSE